MATVALSSPRYMGPTASSQQRTVRRVLPPAARYVDLAFFVAKKANVGTVERMLYGVGGEGQGGGEQPLTTRIWVKSNSARLLG